MMIVGKESAVTTCTRPVRRSGTLHLVGSRIISIGAALKPEGMHDLGALEPISNATA